VLIEWERAVRRWVCVCADESSERVTGASAASVANPFTECDDAMQPAVFDN